ncbi:MAG: tRNA pseudouridine(38-40) synthase TruA [Persicimonas sp.]
MHKQFRIVVAYDGTAYHGWQIQRNARSVEGELERAATRILDCGPDEVKVQGASRTDAGVHALGQVAHIAYDLDKPRTAWDFVRGLNGLTDDDICVVYCEPAPADFHARHSARGKLYRYEIWNHRFPHPLRRHRSWREVGDFDLEVMRRGARQLIGEHDFDGFRAADCHAETSVRELTRVEIFDDRPRIIIEVEGTAFLKYMVRVIVGTLVYMGMGRKGPDTIARMLETKNRSLGGKTAPAHGLTLVEVFYPGFPWEDGAPKVGGRYMGE